MFFSGNSLEFVDGEVKQMLCCSGADICVNASRGHEFLFGSKAELIHKPTAAAGLWQSALVKPEGDLPVAGV